MLKWSQIQAQVWTGNKCRTTKDVVQVNMDINKELIRAVIVSDLVIKR